MIRTVTGGIRSGKSEFAENLLKDKERKVYIATLEATDGEMTDRISKHRERREKDGGYVRTYEAGLDLKSAIGQEQYYLLDSVTGLVSNFMYKMSYEKENFDRELKDEIFQAIKNELDIFFERARDKDIVLVTDETGLAPVSANKIVRAFCDISGKVNQYLAKKSDEVYLVVMGLQVKIK